jgi:hypothetical protein
MAALNNLACDQEVHSVFDVHRLSYGDLLQPTFGFQANHSIIGWDPDESGDFGARHLTANSVTLAKPPAVDENMQVAGTRFLIVHVIAP